jgi:hypothetical protein
MHGSFDGEMPQTSCIHCFASCRNSFTIEVRKVSTVLGNSSGSQNGDGPFY